MTTTMTILTNAVHDALADIRDREFTILGACSMAARTAGWSDGRWNKFHDEATSGDYNHLLRTVREHFVIE
jgi:hypothetical protein